MFVYSFFEETFLDLFKPTITFLMFSGVIKCNIRNKLLKEPYSFFSYLNKERYAFINSKII